MDVPSAKFLSDTVKWVKFSGAAFYKNGFYYSRFDAPVKGKEYSSEDNSQKVFYHKIGDKQENDELIFEVMENEIDSLKELVRREMSSAANLLVSLDVNIGVGPSWDEAAH